MLWFVAVPLLLVAVAGAAAFAVRSRWSWRLLALLLAFAAAGVAWAGWRADLGLAARGVGEPGVDWPADLLITGTVVSIPERQAGRLRFDFALENARALQLPRKVRLSWYDPVEPVRAAERWQLQVRLRAPRGFANPGGFDYEGQLFREGIGAVGYVRAAPDNVRFAAARWRRPVLRLRAAIVECIADVLGDSDNRGVIAGLAVGATHEIGPQQWRVFQATGITHLIAISGLHVTLVAVLGMGLVGLAWRLPWKPAPRRCRRDMAVVVGALAATAYALLAGFSVPTQRTLIMFLAALVALWLRRAQPPRQVLALALIAVLLFDPHAALAAGFWLSFLCVAAILWTMSPHGGPQGKDTGAGAALRAFVRVQGAVTVLLLPATLALFGGVSAVAPLVNLLAIPYFSLVLVPAILLALGLMGIAPQAAAGLLKLSALSLEYFWRLLEWAADLPGAFTYFPAPGPWLLAALAASALILVTPLPWRLRALAVFALLPLLFMTPQRPPPGGVLLTVLDVGQGLSVFVRTHKHALLYDTGPAFRGGRSAADLAVVPFLRHAGIRRLNRLVVSHLDNDHAGGTGAVVNAVHVEAVSFGGEAPPHAAAHLPAQACLQGQSWTWDAVRFEFVHPAPGEGWNRNDGSCVLRIDAPGGSVLLTGDIQARAENALTARDAITPASVVVVPHHGSRTSSTRAFIEAVEARYAIVSAGYRNRWGFPDPRVVERWCRSGALMSGARMSTTAGWGAVSLFIDPQLGPQAPRAFRLEHRRYWHHAPAAAGRSPCLL